ncbi:tetratricopeptide repeat protein [Streptomyces sp. NPDC057696]|uniref:tetratricopeptide repeat protein n=1 Tax=Streptomyces sp. NPDC057696 TaxID=3346218 RepID=UPI0036C9FEC4
MTIHGSVTVVENVGSSLVQNFQQPPAYHLESAVPATRVLSVDAVRRQPSLLLRAQQERIDFVGRTAELQRLHDWCKAEGPASVLLLHGQGGQGKSRLAAQFAAESRRNEWTVLQARHGLDQASTAALVDTPMDLVASPGSQGLLCVVDYAERWSRQDLIAFLNDCTSQRGKVRVLLIARPASRWWQSVHQHNRNLGIPDDRMGLSPLTAEIDRASLFHHARGHFANALGVPPAGTSGPGVDLSGAGFSTVLAVHMAALAEVDAARLGKQAPRNRSDISEYLLGREYEHWEKLQEGGRVTIPPTVFAQTVFTATLTGALSYEDGVRALTRAAIESNEHHGQVLKDHALVYPSGRPSTVLEPLYPDPLGEDFIALLLPDTAAETSPFADSWAIKAPDRLLLGTERSPGLDAAPWTRRTLITLIETAQRWEHVSSGHLEPLLTSHPELVQRAGSAALTALVRIPWLPLEVLDAFEAKLPFRDAEVDAASAEIACHLAPYRLARADDVAHASIHAGLAMRMDNAGRFAEAVEAIDRALPLQAELVGRDPAHLPQLARYLDWAGIMYSRTGQEARALDATQRAVDHYRTLIAAGRTTFRRQLGYALANLGARSIAPEERLAAAQEAVDIARELTGDNPTLDDVELSGSLANLGLALQDLGRHDEALTVLRESASIRRLQAARRFGYYAPHLHSALTALAEQLTAMGHPLEALETIRENISVLTTLAQTNPEAFGRHLAAAKAALRSLERSGQPPSQLLEPLTD